MAVDGAMSQNGNRGWRVFDLLARTRDQRGSLRQCRYCHLPPCLLFCHKHQGVVKNCPKTIASTVAYNRKVPIMVPSPELNVSLEPHLSDALSPLQAVLPEPLRSQLLRTLELSTTASYQTVRKCGTLLTECQFGATIEGHNIIMIELTVVRGCLHYQKRQ